MLVTRYNPNMREFRRGFDLLNSMLDNFTQEENSTLKFDFSPAVNTREGEFAYHVEIDLPGMKKEDISISLEDKTLVISGERKLKEELKEDDYYKIESAFGKFSRSFTLPENVDAENIHAEAKDGVLEVVIPKLKEEVQKVKKIEIK